MTNLSERSLKNLENVDERLVRLVHMANQIVPCAVICGYRSQEDQDKAYHSGHSKLKFPQSSHNSSPSRAVDLCPTPIDWKARERFILFAGVVMGLAASMGIAIRWGGDWNKNWDIRDETFQDLVHFELTK